MERNPPLRLLSLLTGVRVSSSLENFEVDTSLSGAVALLRPTVAYVLLMSYTSDLSIGKSPLGSSRVPYVPSEMSWRRIEAETSQSA